MKLHSLLSLGELYLCLTHVLNLTYINSAAVIGLYTSYVTPIFLRITSGRESFVPGPFSLGKWYMPIGIISVSWVSFIVVLLLFPPASVVDPESMSEKYLFVLVYQTLTLNNDTDYAVVIVMAVFLFASISWVISARHWFHGPVSTINLPDDSNPSLGEKQS